MVSHLSNTKKLDCCEGSQAFCVSGTQEKDFLIHEEEKKQAEQDESANPLVNPVKKIFFTLTQIAASCVRLRYMADQSLRF